MSRGKSAAVNKPPKFTDWVRDTLGVKLAAGQLVLCKVAFDGSEPCDLDGDERELARIIFGDIDTVPHGARHMLAAMCGGRAGKSYILGGLRALYLSLYLPLTLAPGERAASIIVAPDIRLAMQTLRFASGAARSCPSIAALIVADTAEALTLRRADGITIRIEALPASRGGSAVRGRVVACAVLDEACFFRDGSYAVNDEEIYKAISPRIAPGGQLIVPSTPWAESGLLYDFYKRNHGHPVDALAAHAPTLVLRDDDHIREQVERERERDPDNAAREFDAIPMVANAAAWFDTQALADCTHDEVMPPPSRDFHLWDIVAALDTGFRKDPTACVVVARSKSGGRALLIETIEIAPEDGVALVPSEVLKRIVSRSKSLGARILVADQHYIETVKEHASGMHVIEAPGGVKGKSEAHAAARKVVSERAAHIHSSQRRLLSQLRDIVAKPLAGGDVSITSPRKGGAHGDIASAYVLALWALSERGKLGGGAVLPVHDASAARFKGMASPGRKAF